MEGGKESGMTTQTIQIEVPGPLLERARVQAMGEARELIAFLLENYIQELEKAQRRQAYEAYYAAEPWWLDDEQEDTRAEAESVFREVDPWEEPLLDALQRMAARGAVTQEGSFMSSDLPKYMNLDSSQWAKGAPSICRTLVALGFEKTRQRRTGSGKRGYEWTLSAGFDPPWSVELSVVEGGKA